MRYGRFTAAAAVLALTVLLARTGFGHDLIIRVRDGRAVSFGEMVGELKGGQVIYVGETHDNRDHHDLQLRIIRELHRAGKPLAIGLEMFTAANQGQLDRWTAGRLSLESFRTLYLREWNVPWPFYGDIFLFARDKRIPLIGLNVPRDITRKVARTGFDSLTRKERRRLPPDITCDVDPTYMAMIRRSYSDHDTNAKTFKNFCEAQMLWNKTMAFHLLEFVRKYPGRTVVVIAGSGHAIRGGMPAQVTKANAGFAGFVVLPDPAIPASRVTLADADYLWLSH